MVENKKIILVGNGPSLSKSYLGNIIDNFDDVVRFNNYEISGFEEHVGNKTTIWARNNSKTVKVRDTSVFDKVLIVSPAWNFGNTNSIKKNYKNGFVIPSSFSLKIQNLLGLNDNRFNRRRGWPTTGIITLYYFLSIYKVVYICGFDHFENGNHYFGSEKYPFWIVNTREKEKEWVTKMEKQGRVIRILDNEMSKYF